jgi:hypothetical protein
MSNSQIGFGSNKKTRHMMPSGHKAFLVSNPRDVDLLLMHSKTFAAEFVHESYLALKLLANMLLGLHTLYHRGRESRLLHVQSSLV